MKKQTILLSIFGVTAIVAVFAIVAMATITHNRSTLTPAGVTTLFYNEWSEQVAQSPTQPLDNRLHERSTYVSPLFTREVNKQFEKTAKDPVLCSARPEAITVEVVAEEEEYASVVVSDSTGPDIVRAVLTRDEKGWWRIDETDCLS